ncbi:MAG: sigma-70 family RNA polymerase sigma factor, partial [Longimicrobiales bacterium]
QVVWLRASKRAGLVQSERAWLFRVATHAALDRVRTERRRARLLAMHATQDEQVDAADGEWLDEAGRARVRECCMGLPRKQRDAVWHRWIEQQDYETVAARLGVNVDTARANVYHGLKRLRRELEDLWVQENE